MRRWRWALGAVALGGLALGGFLLQPATGPARDLSLVADAEHGAYLIRLGGCVACHTDTKANGAMLAGGAPIVSPFGTFVPPNITSDSSAGIGNWTLADFSRAMSDGVGPKGNLYPAFPYDSYTLMSDQDIVDLYAALQQVPPVSTPAAPNRVPFPFNQRIGLSAWKTLFFHPARFEPDAARSVEWNRGKYLAWGPGHCVACHTPRNPLGARDDGRPLAGSAGGPAGKVPAIDTASLEKLGYDAKGLIEVLKGGVTPSFDVPGREMGAVISQSTSYWTDSDLTALAAYLLDQ